MAKPKRKKVPPDFVFIFKFSGSYHTRDKGTKPFEIECYMMQRHVEEGFMSVFKNDIAPTLMPQKYHDYQSLSKWRFIEARPADPDEDMPENMLIMSHKELLEYIERLNYPIKTVLFTHADELRQAIIDYEDEPEAFLSNQELRWAKRGKRASRKEEVMLLNALPVDIALPKQVTPTELPLLNQSAPAQKTKGRDALAGV